MPVNIGATHTSHYKGRGSVATGFLALFGLDKLGFVESRSLPLKADFFCQQMVILRPVLIFWRIFSRLRVSTPRTGQVLFPRTITFLPKHYLKPQYL